MKPMKSIWHHTPIQNGNEILDIILEIIHLIIEGRFKLEAIKYFGVILLFPIGHHTIAPSI
jgi:hypothetical protein